MFHNIGILAHVDSGKTTLTEQILYRAGVIRSAGSVDSGTTATDNLSIERQRGISVRTSTASADWGGATLNIIDTPGHVDFAGEVERSLCALDYAVVVVSAVEGVRAHTENILKALDDANLPCCVFVNKIDRAGADVEKVMAELSQVSSRTAVLLSSYTGQESDTPAVKTADGDDFAGIVTEALCDVNEEAGEAFLMDETLSGERARAVLEEEISACRVIPVLAGSAKLGGGVTELMDFITAHMPSAERRASDGLCGVIFKIEHDKVMGKVSHVRMFGGKIVNRDEVELIPPADTAKQNPDGEENDAVELEEKPNPREKVAQIRKFTGGKYTDAGEIGAGDIGALCGLPSAKTGHFVYNGELIREK